MLAKQLTSKIGYVHTTYKQTRYGPWPSFYTLRRKSTRLSKPKLSEQRFEEGAQSQKQIPHV